MSSNPRTDDALPLTVGCRLSPKMRERFQTYIEDNGYRNTSDAIRELIRQAIYS